MATHLCPFCKSVLMGDQPCQFCREEQFAGEPADETPVSVTETLGRIAVDVRLLDLEFASSPTLANWTPERKRVLVNVQKALESLWKGLDAETSAVLAGRSPRPAA